MLKNIKLVVTDLDGTVLEKGQLANSHDLEVLLKLQKGGVFLSIATGQDWSNAQKTALDFQIDNHLNYIICNNGAYISSVNQYNPIYVSKINQEIVEMVYNQCLKWGICWIAFYQELKHVYWNGIPLECQSLIERQWPKKYIWLDISKNQNFIYNGVVQMMIFVPKNLQQTFCNWTKAKNLHQVLNIMETNIESMPIYEFTNIAANKGNAVLNLAKHLKIEPSRILVFGDNMNDLEMFMKIPNSVAVANAVSKVKKSAKYLTDTNLNGGVGQFIEKNILKEEN